MEEVTSIILSFGIPWLHKAMVVDTDQKKDLNYMIQLPSNGVLLINSLNTLTLKQLQFKAQDGDGSYTIKQPKFLNITLQLTKILLKM